MSEKLIRALDEVRALPEITLDSIAFHLKGEALLILALIAIIPFMQPIPIPGVSTLLGLLIFLQGVGLTFYGKPFLTEKLKKIVIPKDKFEIIYRTASRFNSFSSKISTFQHPIGGLRITQIVCGISIMVSAAFLSLPLPIPFSNFVPAMGIFLICVGLLEHDLVLIMCGQFVTAAVIWMAVFSYHLIRDQVHSWF